MFTPSTYCAACGYDLKLASPDDIANRCPSCGFRFQHLFDKPQTPFNTFNRDDLVVRIWRGQWAEAHLPWRGSNIPKPEGWDPIKQLLNIGLNWGASFEEWQENNPVISSENNEKFLKIALNKIEKLDWKPEVIEALWDGDTQGWFLDVCVSTSQPTDGQSYRQYLLLSLRGAGGDLRAINRQVPPWPEAEVGAFVGDGVSKLLSIPFYFPSPDQPDDNCADWWHRDETLRSVSCGKYLRKSAHMKENCYPCELRDKRTNK